VPFLYRPLLPFKKYDLKKATDGFTRIGAFQHGVEDGQSYNSYLNPIVFEEPRSYNLQRLRPNVHKHINKALTNNVTVSRILDESEFYESAYPCYVSFYERTGYAVDLNRIQKHGFSQRRTDGFSQWSHALFQFPEVVVFGAYSGPELVSFEICCLVEDTLVLKTHVNSDKGLKLVASDLLQHTCRIRASEQPNIHLIYDSLLGQVPSINDFYIYRGARVLVLPAFLHLHPALLWSIKKTNKNIYKRLLGLGSDELPECGGTTI
jgi:hypothetical protein